MPRRLPVLSVHVHRLFLALTLAVLVAACDTAEGPSLYDPIEEGTYQSRPDPVLTSISPPSGEALAGVSELTLTGQHFIPSAESTFVYFNGVRYPVLEITPTTIRMRAPNLPSNGLRVKVSVLRAEHFTQVVSYDLLPAVRRLGALAVNEQPIGLATDADGNAYVSYLVDGIGAGIRKVTPEGSFSLYATPSGVTYPGLAFDATYGLLGVRNLRAIFKINQGGSDAGTPPYFVFSPSALRLRTVDVDAAGNVWAGGNGTQAFYRVSPTNEVTTIPVAGNVLAIEAREDYVYVATLTPGATTATSVARILRYPLGGGTVGGVEEVVNVTDSFPGLQVTSLAFSANGDLFMGTSLLEGTAINDTPVLELVDGTLRELYPGLLDGNVSGLGWGMGTTLYAAGARVVADENSRATTADLVQINTLRDREL